VCGSGHWSVLLHVREPIVKYAIDRVDVSQNLASRAATFSEELFSWDAIVPLLVAFPLVLIPVWFTVYAGLKPLRSLSEELVARKSDDLDAVRSSLVYVELAPIVVALNAMLARIKDLLRREREFLADAAHELRTPLALITAQSDTLMHAEDAQDRK
jgi:two-component system, OmpR family, sensor histidine kinase QseC